MGQIIIRNWDLRDFDVRVNSPSPIRQVLVRIWRVPTLIRGLPNQISEVVPLVSQFRSYPPHCSHLHCPSLSFSTTTSTIITELIVKSFLSISPCRDLELTLSTSTHRVQQTPSTAYTEYSTHRVQHTPSTAYTEFSIYWVQHTPSTAYTKYSIHRVQHTLSTA